ncbi:ADP-ribosyltransferase [Sphingomonas sp.]|uniref:ADP-ribosyltransferase n=1 Tax=Sphingomonas sp. TaxID=28214 RepID=UPI003CC5E225
MADPQEPAALAGAFRRPFKQQVAFFRQKMGNLVPTRRWDDLTGAAHDQAFMVAGAQKADLLSDFAASIDRAVSEGASLEQFRSDFDAAVERHDWHGWTGEGTKGGRAWRTRTIYRTNTSTSYAAGRFAQLTAANWKYWIYRHGNSQEPRPEHLHVFDGLILPPDHPFWAKFYPPSDWGCSCYVLGANTLAQAKRLGGTKGPEGLPDGWDTPDPATGEPPGIGPGWGYAPGASVVEAVNAKVASWSEEIAQAFTASLPSMAGDDADSFIRSVSDLSDEERDAIRGYTAGDHVEINGALRDGAQPTPAGAIIDQALDRARLPADVVVHRGLGGDLAAAILEEAPPRGAILRDLGFASTSRRVGVARKFLRLKPEPKVLVTLRLKRGARALDIASISAFEDQREMLLQRQVKWRVLSWDKASGQLEVEVGP